MSERIKKIGAVVLFIGSVFGIGFLLYRFFFASPPPAATVEEQPAVDITGTGLPTAGEGVRPTTTSTEPTLLPKASEVAKGGVTKTTTLTTSAVQATTLSGNGKDVQYYDPADSRFYTITQDGTVKRLSDHQFPDAQAVSWNRNGEKAAIEFPDGSNVVYDFTSEKQTTLPRHWEDFSFAPTSEELFAKSIGLDPGNRALVISNADGSNVQAVQALGENADKVQISPSPNRQVIAFSETGDVQAGFGRSMILPIGKNQENFKGLIVEGIGFSPLWSPRGDMLLYSVSGESNAYRPSLWTVDGSSNSIGDDRTNLGIATWVDKCTFSSNTTVYCGVPRNLPENAGLQRSLVSNTPDDLYQIDLSTGRASLTARPENDTTMENLRVSEDGASLFYTNVSSGRLETIKLK